MSDRQFATMLRKKLHEHKAFLKRVEVNKADREVAKLTKEIQVMAKKLARLQNLAKMKKEKLSAPKYEAQRFELVSD